MNLPAHGTASPDPSIIVSLTKPHTKCKYNSVSTWPGPHAARRNCSRPPGGIHFPPGASALQTSLFSRHRLAEHTVPPGACSVQTLAKAIAWRLSVDRQAPYQKHSAAGFGTQFS
ncbi:hypothetical protein DEO72_LG1g2279 [Vigna unguiculata]|uniref:Uncharacterized protein n=1 Tax=Vigna unguiculata TaxID=3917 RepID=A0A4D6KQ61_VIGUN|nr:hypothetical protein DEO72_LG1g2279 [Vigna unguiculata]